MNCVGCKKKGKKSDQISYLKIFSDVRNEDTRKLEEEMKSRNEKIKELEETLNDLELKLNLENENSELIKQIKTNNNIYKLVEDVNTKLTTTNGGDYNLLKDECTQLKTRIEAIEDEMKRFLFFS